MEKTIAVLLPCKDEASSIGLTIQAFRQALPTAHIYVFDNGSTDKTAENARSAQATVIASPLPGKGNVIAHMFREIKADIYLICDGDDTYPADLASKMIASLAATGADMVVGSRLGKNNSSSFSFSHWFGNRFFTHLASWLFKQPVYDLLSGYRVMTRQLVETLSLSSPGFEVETELTLKTLQGGFKITDFPISYSQRQHGSSKLKAGRDGLRILVTLLKTSKKELIQRLDPGSLGLAWIIALVFFLFFRAKGAFQVGSPAADDGCYVDYLYQLIKMPSWLHCRSESYPPGIAVAWLPAGLTSLLLHKTIGWNFDVLLPCIIAVLGFSYWAFSMVIIYQIERSVWRAALFLLSIPVLYYATFRSTMVHSVEVFIALACVAALMRKRLYLAFGLAIFLSSIRIADAPICFLVAAAAWEQKKESKVFKSVIALFILAMVLWVAKVMLVDGYNNKFLGDLFKTISIHQLAYVFFAFDSGVMWFSPWWIICFIFGACQVHKLSWLGRASLSWMLLELLIICSWGDNGSDFSYRYLLGSFAAAWVVSLELEEIFVVWKKISLCVQSIGLLLLLPLTWLYRMSVFTTPFISWRTFNNPYLVTETLKQIFDTRRMLEPFRYSPFGTIYYSAYFPNHIKYSFDQTPAGQLQLTILIVISLVSLLVLLSATYWKIWQPRTAIKK